MGITAPSLYAAFGDKERPYLEAVGLYKSDLGNSGRILAAETTERAAIERLLEASAIELTNTKEHPPGCMVVASAINGSPRSAHLQAALRGCRLERRRASPPRLSVVSGTENFLPARMQPRWASFL